MKLSYIYYNNTNVKHTIKMFSLFRTIWNGSGVNLYMV